MNGKYIGSHPITLKKAETNIKAVNAPTKHDNKNNKGGKGGKNGANGRADTGAGVQKKKPTRTKDGIKILG